MGSSIVTAAAAALAFQPGSAGSVALEPSGPWKVELLDGTCALSRDYGSNESKVELALDPVPAGDRVRLILLHGGELKQSVTGKAEMTFDAQSFAEAPFKTSPAKGLSLQITEIFLERPDLLALPNSKALGIQAGDFAASMVTTSVGEALKALSECEHDLLVAWGMDEATLQSIAVFPKPRKPVVSLLTTNDYPQEALRNREQGTSAVRYWVGADGRASECQVVASSGSASIDQQTCAIVVKRARFEPARTHDGRLVRSISYQAVRWELP